MPGLIIAGDCLDVLPALWAEGLVVQSIVTDPAYGLGFMGATWDAPANNTAFQPEVWRLCFDLLPPGGHLVASGATRTYHRLACAIEDAGFEIRDMLTWIYGSGFPKSLDVSKAIDKQFGAEREVVGTKKCDAFIAISPGSFGADRTSIDITIPATPEAERWDGWHTSLKPACEPIVLARKPLEGTVAENVLKHGVGALNIDACRVSYKHDAPDPATNPLYRKQHGYANTAAADRDSSSYRLRDEPAERNPHLAGRWPANLVHDGSDEVVDCFPQTGGGGYPARRGKGGIGTVGYKGQTGLTPRRNEPGNASRFFYCAKAGKAERAGSKHPTVKPLALMRWLVRLVTPPGGLVLDPFAGTGTTGQAVRLEGRSYILIEREPAYLADIERRLGGYPTKSRSR